MFHRDLEIVVHLTCLNLKFPITYPGKENSNGSSGNPSQEMSEATVDIKKLLAFLQGQLVSPIKVICSK